MAVDLRDAPVFLTRAECAALLRLHERSIDRIAEVGGMKKQKLGPRRSGFHRDQLADYLERQGHEVIRPNAPSGAPGTLPVLGIEFVLGGHSGQVTHFGNKCLLLRIRCEGGAVEVAPAIEAELIAIGIRGLMITAHGDILDLMWAKSLQLAHERVSAAVETIRAKSRLAA
jgi:hypothetical protein